MEMYKKGYDKHTNQIFIEKTGAGGKIVVALAEGNFIRKIQQHIKTDLKNFKVNIDEAIGGVLRYFILKNSKIVRNKIVFGTFQNAYTCNAKYIAEKIIEDRLNYEIVFIVDDIFLINNDEYDVPNRIKFVKRNSLESFLELASAHFWVDNALNCIWKKIPKKKGQIYLNTWHGSLGIKRLNGDKHWRRIAKRGNSAIDYFITDSKFEEDVFQKSFWPDVKCLKYGHPRNDIFIDPDKINKAKSKVYSLYGLEEHVKTVLYAPTFRDNKSDVSAINVDYAGMKAALEKKFGGEWVVIAKLHFHNATNNRTKDLFCKEDVIDASTYPDIQELMAAADIGITDYSSWIFDFLLTKKPAFIYARDIEKYRNSRGFYYSLDETPFSIAESNKKLQENILRFESAVYLEQVESFLAGKQCYETGNACEQVVKFICDHT